MSVILSLCLLSYYPYFLTLYPGGQQTAMGGANVAIAEDAFGIFYNPGGLALQKALDIGFERNSIPWADKPTYWATALNLPLNKKITFGIYGEGVYDRFIGYSIEGDPYHWINWNDFSAGFSFAYKISDYFGTGIGVKYIHSSFGSDWMINSPPIAQSFGVDIGSLVRYNFLYGKIRVGIALQNLGPKIYFINSYKDNIPLNFRAGLSYSISAKDLFKHQKENWLSDWFYEKWRVVISYDINKVIPKPYPTIPSLTEKLWHSFGVEIRPIPIFAFRFGHFNDNDSRIADQRKDWTFGLGLDLKFLRFDISNDNALYYVNTNRLKISLSVNISEPIFPKNGFLSVLNK